ncbi:uncharacterized protein EV420DRAFT_1025373 [Desarmillaria tabescens]|uniref:F-box domain-containing protein n=1 Tax=Armillaria tabescens TaxID=1929756 RepID=A0AA39JK75_ARMTA|nr:uncharacterized protein EV420DRAFT_1025373 [Desarmillaria tabescens]KAK0443445.1 hypothetical protein EV420DRAFT_1025373 [Desarmillaria tabescens]
MNDALYNLPNDVLIYIIAFLSVPDILLLRQTCKRFNTLTRLHIVWTNAFKLDILSNGYPAPIDDTDLEQRTLHSYRLTSRWLANSPLMPASETSFTGSPVSEIKFIPGRQHKWLLTVSKGTRSVLAIWDIVRRHKCSEWSPRGVPFTGVRLNTDTESEASIAVALDGSQRIALLHLDDDGTLREIHSFDIDLHLVTLTGDIMALSDDLSKTLIYNWRTDERAYLDEGDMQHGHCIQVIFTALTILVIRARSINLYTTLPFLHGQTHSPVASHSFRCVDGASATPTSVLIRSEIDNSWISGLDLFKLYSISSFPPTFTSEITSQCGSLQCTDVILGKCETAVWIRPYRVMTFPDQEHRETLMAAVFPGPLNPTAKPRVREVCPNPLNNWTALDYDEELGRIALGSGFGKITVVQL